MQFSQFFLPLNRYLWPLIHYHKFLAKCIKKLKRNNVDVKTSLSPVSAFLREEVCAVSDHLAATSKFTSEEWMEVSLSCSLVIISWELVYLISRNFFFVNYVSIGTTSF